VTSTAVDVTKRLAQIHETGYWRVVISPTVIEPKRIATLDDCWRIVEESQVSFRGRWYPELEAAERADGDDWIQSGIAWDDQLELWRFYQSGQFVHHSSVFEDRMPPTSPGGPRQVSPLSNEPRRLSFLEVLYSMTEILAFAQGLAYRKVLEPSANICIELHGMKGRKLVGYSARRLPGRYVADTDCIHWETTSPSVVILAISAELALEAAIHVFKRFGWEDPTPEMLKEDQRRLLEHRL
jgi:hypothetical protein